MAGHLNDPARFLDVDLVTLTLLYRLFLYPNLRGDICPPLPSMQHRKLEQKYFMALMSDPKFSIFLNNNLGEVISLMMSFIVLLEGVS